jgi:hypothetical protein
MPFSERQAGLLRLLANVDQTIQEAKSLSSCPLLSKRERIHVAAHLQLRRRVRKRVEVLLAELER